MNFEDIQDSPLAKSLDARLEAQRQRIAKHKEFLNRQKEAVKRTDDSLSDDDDFRSSSSSWRFSRSESQPKKSKIEDALLDYGRQLEEQKEQMRQQYLQSQDEPFRPHISESSRKLVKDSSMDVIERLDFLEKERVEKLEQMQKEKDQNFSHRPKISKFSLDLAVGDRSNVVEINRAWVENRESKLDKLRSMRPLDEIKEETFAPKLNPNTLKIVEKMKQQKKRDRGDMPFEEYLGKKEMDRQKALMKKTEDHYNSVVPAQPRITQRAAEIVREGSVSDRLYEESFKLSERKLEIQQQKQMQEQIMYEFQPRINTLDIDRGDSHVFDHLLKREEQAKMKKQENMEKLLAKEKQLHHPKINPVSEEIASRLPSSSQERLLQTTKQVRQEHDPNWTFHPEINKKSKQIESEKSGFVDVQSRIDRLYNHEKKKKEKIRQLRSEFEMKELEECTFVPKMKKADIRVAPFEERTTTWEKKRKAKMARERAVIDRKSMQECTFRPSTNAERRLLESSLRAGRSTDSILSGSSEDPLGFEEFVQRQREARAMKEQSVKGVFSTGDKWRNEVTVPKEFSLGLRRPTVIKSLRKPLSPSRYSSRTLEDNDDAEQDGNNSSQEVTGHRSTGDTNDNSESIIDLLSEVPPQGLFSALSSVSILEGMHHLYQSPASHQDSSSRNQAMSTFLSGSLIEGTASDEWVKRSLLKNEVSQITSPRTRTPGLWNM